MLEAIFSEGVLTVTVTGLTQWDYGRKLTIKGLSYTDSVEVHFSNNVEKLAIVMEATKSGSDLVTEVPNVLLEKNHDITAWVYLDSGTSGETVRTIILKVKPRIKPADYISENNAGEVIDYVAKAEEYANSAQESAKSAQDNAEQVQVNTDIVKDLLANVPDFDSYEKLAEHNKLLYDGLYVKGETYSGIASNKGIKLHKVVGKTEQETTNGYQLFDSSKIATKTQGGATVTNNNDGSFTVSGSGTISERYVSDTPYTDIPFQLKAGKLYLLQDVLTYPSCYIDFADESGIFVVSISIISGNDRAEIELTSEQASKIKKYKPIFVGNANEPIRTGTVKPMLYQDGDGTFEQYTGGKPAPNSDYAMDIENVEIKKINSTAKNIVKSFKTLGTTQYSGALEVDALFKPNTAYTITLTSKYAGKFYLNESLFTSPTKANFTNPNETKSVIATTLSEFSEQNAKYILKNAENNTTVEFSNVQIEEGEESTEYVVGNYSKIETSLTFAEGDVYEDGVLTRKRVKIEINENSYIVRNDSYPNTRFECSSRYNSSYVNGVLGTGVCNRLKVSSLPVYGNTMDETITCYKDGGLYFRFDRFSTVEELKEWLKTNPIIYEYDLLTPTTEELKVPTVPSYYHNTNIWTDNTLPTDIEWELLANSDNSLYQEELEKRIQALEAQILGL